MRISDWSSDVCSSDLWFGWQWLQVRMQHERSAETRAAEHVSALEQRIDALQHEQRAQAKRLQQADTTNRVLRDELLGIGQRAALLEDSGSQLDDPETKRTEKRRGGKEGGRQGRSR